MWWVRLVARSRWELRDAESDSDVREASNDLEPRPSDNGGLSVYRVLESAEAQNVAVACALGSGPPKKVDYLLIPQECFLDARLELRAEPDPEAHPFLSERHYCVYGLTACEIRIQIARAILASKNRIIARVTESRIKQLAIEMTASDATWKDHVLTPERWPGLFKG